MKATVHDVAKLAGVSTKTVSRVVNDQGEISEATRARVQAAIEQLGYRPNILARSLVRQRSNTLAIVTWGIDYYAPSRIVVGIEQKSVELGYSLLFTLVDHPCDKRAPQVLDKVLEHQVAGIIWAVPEVDDNRAWLDTSKMEHLPPMIFLTMGARPDLTTLSIDNRLGGYQATQHLIEQGNQRIALISGHLDWWEARERYAGWQQALQQAGLRAESSLVVETDWSVEGGALAMQTLLERGIGIDGVFAGSDQIALGALSVIHRSGLRVPQDISIIGFDDIPESAYFEPPLTTIHQPLIDLGYLAVETLCRMISAKAGSPTVEMPTNTVQKPELVIRASTQRSP